MKWTELVRSLGANDPSDWVNDGATPEQARVAIAKFLFLRNVMRSLVTRGSPEWIGNMIASAQRDPDGPMAGAGLALLSLRGKGASDAELTELVRAVQGETIFEVCTHLDGLDEPNEILEQLGLGDLQWTLVVATTKEEFDERKLIGLHENVLQADPDGRELRPGKLT